MLIKVPKQTVDNSKKVAALLSATLSLESEIDQDKEHFWVLGLTIRNQLKYLEFLELAALGTLDSCPVSPREIFRYAITQGVAAVIVAHNHPSNRLEPSREDILCTQRLQKAGRLLNVALLDHVIINGKGDYISFKQGLIAEDWLWSIRNREGGLND